MVDPPVLGFLPCLSTVADIVHTTYIFRANALENNVMFFLYASGQRSILKRSSVPVPSGKWQGLKVEVVGNRFRGFLDGRLVAEVTDGSYKAGKVGLWTKADSDTCFDNVRVIAR